MFARQLGRFHSQFHGRNTGKGQGPRSIYWEDKLLVDLGQQRATDTKEEVGVVFHIPKFALHALALLASQVHIKFMDYDTPQN